VSNIKKDDNSEVSLADEVTLRPFRDDDLDGVIALITGTLNSIYSSEELRRIWKWKFSENPFSLKQAPHAIVLEHGGRIVGNTGQVAIPIKLGEKLVTGYANSDFAVEEGYRTYGLRLASRFWRNTEVPFLLATSANEVACAVDKVFGARELISARTRWFKVRHPLRVLGALNRQKNGAVGKSFTDNLWLLPVSGLRSLVGAPRGFIKVSGDGLEVKEVSEFGQEFDELWEEVSHHYPVAVVRNSRYLSWRYAQYPLGKPYMYAAYRGGKLHGFTVVQVSGRLVDIAIKQACITELFTRPGDRVAQRRLLKAALACAKNEDVDVVQALGFAPEVCKLLEENLFLRTKTRWSPYLYKNNGGAIASVSEEDWFVSLGDGDAVF
jgi:hypothetical protein